jgi:hypothetical protein
MPSVARTLALALAPALIDVVQSRYFACIVQPKIAMAEL